MQNLLKTLLKKILTKKNFNKLKEIKGVRRLLFLSLLHQTKCLKVAQ